MYRVAKLKQLAKKAAEFRGHDMSLFITTRVGRGLDTRTIYNSICKRCSKSVKVIERPEPNETHIAGEAVALYCIQKLL